MSPSVKKAYVDFRNKRKFMPKTTETKEIQKSIIIKRDGVVIRRILK